MKKNILVLLSIILIGTLTSSILNAQTTESKIIKLSEKNFDKGIKSGLVLVDFYADWCRPCKMMQPILESVASKHSEKITIAKLNTDNNKMLSQKYKISGIPAMILFKNGKEIARIIGYHDEAALIQKLEPHF